MQVRAYSVKQCTRKREKRITIFNTEETRVYPGGKQEKAFLPSLHRGVALPNMAAILQCIEQTKVLLKLNTSNEGDNIVACTLMS